MIDFPLLTFLFQTNPSPSEETNHTDSLSTSYDTSADAQSLNASTPGQGALHDYHGGLDVRTKIHKHVQMHLLSPETSNRFASSGEGARGGRGHSGAG